MRKALASWLSGPLGLDPMMRKEFYGLSRRWQTYFFRSVYVGLMGLVVWIAWKSFRTYEAMSYTAYAELGSIIFRIFGSIQYFLIALAALAAGSDMISKEVRARTLGMLAITPLGSWRIVLGKWKSCVGYLVIILVSGVPILALGIYLGGVGGEELFKVTILTLVTAMLCAAWSVLCSTMVRRAYLSQVLSTCGMVLYCLLPVFLALAVDRRGDGEKVIQASCWIFPVYSFALTISDLPPGLVTNVEWSWVGASVVSLLETALLLLIASGRVRKLSTAEPGTPLGRRMFEGLDRVFERSPLGVKLWGERSAVWNFNPFLWKELRSRITGKFRYFTRIGVLLLAGFGIVITAFAGDLNDRETVGTIFVVLMVLLFLASVGAGSGTFTQEKEDKKWDILLTTPMGAGSVLIAKFTGAFLGILHFLLMMALFGGVISFFVTFYYGRAHPGPVITASSIFAFFTLCVGMLFSLIVKSTRKAYVLTLAVVFFFLVAIPLFLSLVMLLEGRYDGEYYKDVLAATNPFWYLSEIWDRGGNAEWIVPYSAIYLLLSAWCLLVSYTRFNALAGRSP